jgi:hypothetical protein
MKKLHLVVCVTVALCCTAVSVFAGEEATKAAATSKTAATIIPANDGKWHTVLTTAIKNPTADDDLFVDVSQVNRLTTSNVTSTATHVSIADARLNMRVLVDGVACQPGPIVFDEQLTTLSSNLQAFQTLNCKQTTVPNTIITTSCVCRNTTTNVASSCSPVGPPPPGTVRTCTSVTAPDPDIVTTCSLVPGANQSLSTLLSETIAHSYDFLCPGVGGMGDTHTVQVQEMLTQVSTNGSATATIGPQTLKVLSVDLKPAQ